MKRKITEEAQELAIQFVDWWKNGLLSQSFEMVEMTAGSEEPIFKVVHGADDSLTSFTALGALQELAKADLIDINIQQRPQSKRISVTLLQDLRDAVEGKFAISDNTQEPQTVTIVNYLWAQDGSTIHFANAIGGDAVQNIESVVNNLESMLGQEILEQFTELKAAIQDLNNINKENSPGKLGKAIKELGNCLEHGANAATVIPAIIQLAQLFIT